MLDDIPRDRLVWRTRTLAVLRTVVSLHAAAVFLQAVSAGLWLSGSGQAQMGHAHGARLVIGLGLTQLVVAALLWRRGGGPAWPTFASLGTAVMEVIQIATGMQRAFAWHVPIGVMIFAGVLRLLTWAWTERAVSVPLATAATGHR